MIKSIKLSQLKHFHKQLLVYIQIDFKKFRQIIEIQVFCSLTDSINNLMAERKQAKSENSLMSATNFVMYQKLKQSGSRHSERVTMKQEDSYHHALAREYFHLGNEHQKSRQYKLSINFFLTALKYKYDSPEIHNNLGVVYVLNKEYQKAEQSFNKSVQNKLSQIFPKINLANLKFKQDKFTAGIQIFLQLLSVNKDKRIINHLNKVLISHNNFYRFFKHNLMASHADIDGHTLECSIKYIMENVSPYSPITIESQVALSVPNLSEAQIEEIHNIFNTIRLKYSSLKFMKNRSELIQTTAYGQELAKCIQGLKSQKASNIIKLLFMYVFMEEQKTDLSLYFYSLIDKFQNKQILAEYQQLYRNYLNIKKEQNVPFHWHYSVVIQKQNSQKRREIIESIERFFFREKLPVFRLHQIRNWKSLPDGERTLQLLVKCFQDLQNYQQISAIAFQEYKQKYDSTFDYDLQAAVAQYFVHRYKSLEEGREMIQSVALRSLNDYDYLSQNEKFKDFEWLIVVLYIRKRFQKAIQTCNSKIAEFKDNEDKIEQYIASIYLTTHHYEKAFEHLKIAQKINPNNPEINYKLACHFFVRLSLRRTNAKSIFQIRSNEEYFLPHIEFILLTSYQLSLQYILNAISIDPTRIKYYYLLEMLYQHSYYLNKRIPTYLNTLLQESYLPKDFKVRANIAIFNAMTYQYDKSYQYFRNILHKGLSEADTNCQDVELFYFIRRCCDTVYFLTKDYEQFGWATQIGFYLVIFYHTSELFDKYDENSHQLDPKYFELLNKHFERAIQLPEQLIKRLERLNYNHKQIIYRYIFRCRNLKKNAADLVRLHEKIGSLEDIRYALFYLETQANLKQYKIAALKEIFNYLMTFEHSIARNEYLNKSYLVILGQIIKYQSQLPANSREKWISPTFRTKFTSFAARINTQSFVSIKFLRKQCYQLSSSELQNLVFKSILRIQNQFINYKKISKDKKELRTNTLYQGIVLLVIEEVLPYICQSPCHQKMLAATCQQFLIDRNINLFHANIGCYFYEYQDSLGQKSEFNPFSDQNRQECSKMSVLSEISSNSMPKFQKCIQYKYPQYNELPEKDAQYDTPQQSQYEKMMQTHLRQEDLQQLLDQIKNQGSSDDECGKNRLIFFMKVVDFVKNCEELDILVTNLQSKCYNIDLNKFSIDCNQLIKIGKTNKKYTSNSRLFQYTCEILREIMKIQQRNNKSSLSYDKRSFYVLMKNECFRKRQQNNFGNLIQFCQIARKGMKKYHLEMLQDMYKLLFNRQHYYSKKLKFYMKLLIMQKINYNKFLRLVQANLTRD